MIIMTELELDTELKNARIRDLKKRINNYDSLIRNKESLILRIKNKFTKKFEYIIAKGDL